MAEHAAITEEAQLREEIASLKAQVKQLTVKKRYGLLWEEEKAPDEVVRALKENLPYLKRDASKTVHAPADAPQHSLIKGDNYYALMALLPQYKNRVDMIYIDPPYNTGSKDFIYNDRYVDPEDDYRHSKWLNFMQPRLQLGKKLLAETGVIFISIDDNEYAHLKLLMDEIFGEKNFIANIIWQGGKKNNARYVSVGHDYILVYAKSKIALDALETRWRVEKQGINLVLNKASEIFTSEQSFSKKQKAFKAYLQVLKRDGLIGDSVARYALLDERDGRPFRSDRDISAPGGNGLRYEVLHPTLRQAVPTPAPGWRWTKERMRQEIAAGRVYFGADASNVPRGKIYLEDLQDEVFASVFHQERSAGSEQLAQIIGKGSFSFPKEINVLKRLISMATTESDIILDFFAGSGTTGQAVAQLNSEDGGKRTCILVTDAGKPSETGVDIADDVTYQRMSRVLTGENWADGKSHPNLHQGLIYDQVEMLPHQVRLATDFDEQDQPIYAAEAAISSSVNMLAELKRKTELEETIAASLIANWQLERR